MGLASTFTQVAKDLVAQHGATATLTRKANAAYNPTTGEAAVSSATVSVKAVIEQFATRLVDGTRIMAGDHKATIAANTLTAPPEIGDTLTIAGAVWRVVNVTTDYYASTPVIYSLQLRR